MTYREMIKKVQDYSGFSDQESESALRTFIKSLAKRLTIDERKDLASQLPSELQDDALHTQEQEEMEADDLMAEIALEQDIDQSHAKKQIMAAWQALKDAITPGEINHIKAQLPQSMNAMLY